LLLNMAHHKFILESLINYGREATPGVQNIYYAKKPELNLISTNQQARKLGQRNQAGPNDAKYTILILGKLFHVQAQYDPNSYEATHKLDISGIHISNPYNSRSDQILKLDDKGILYISRFVNLTLRSHQI